MTRGSGVTRVDEVYRRMKDDICLGTLLPGSKLSLTDVSKDFGVSLTVVREAVTRLTAERLVEASPNQGFRVWPLSVPDLLDLTRVRIEVEGLVLRESVAAGDLEWEAVVVAAHHRLVGASKEPVVSATGPNYKWRSAHAEFHAALGAACTSPLLRTLRQQLFDSALLYQHWAASIGKAPRGRKRDVTAEHRTLVEAALAHDTERVIDAIAAHIQRTTDSLLTSPAAQAEAAGEGEAGHRTPVPSGVRPRSASR